MALKGSLAQRDCAPILVEVSVADRVAEWLPVLWFVVAGCLLAFAAGTGLLSSLLRRLTKAGGFGVSFDFSPESAKATRDTIEGALGDLRKTITRELEAEVRARSLQRALGKVLQETQLRDETKFRATIHIQDPLFNDWLYQLLDYYPTGGGHGRSFSTRAGIIGKVWRTDRFDTWRQEEGVPLRRLIQEWGMTPEEAARRQVSDETKGMMAIPLHDRADSRPIAVMYLDSTEPNLFGANEHAREALVAEITASHLEKLADPLTDLVETVLRSSPQLSEGGA